MISRNSVADDAGALLVRSGLVSSSALDDARARVADMGGTLGEQLVAAGALEDDALTSFYQQRLLVPKVNPNTLARLPARVVAVIPADMAVELRAIPVSLDADNNLTVAMSDPSDRHAVDEISYFTGSYVVRAVATQMQIAWCLAHYYGHVTSLGQRLLQDDAASTSTDAAVRPRTKSVTEQVRESRHKRIERGELTVDAVRGASRQAAVSGELSTTNGTTPASEESRPRPRTASGEIRVPARRAASIKPPLPEDSGPIVIPAPEISGPTITIEADADEPPRDSGPVITMEAEEAGDDEPEISFAAAPLPSEERTDRKMPMPRRKRPAEPDPPELAARAGEVQLASGSSIQAIDFDEPSIMISEELERALRPTVTGEVRVREHKDSRPPPVPSISVELDGTESGPVVIHQVLGERSEPVLLERRRASDPPPSAQVSDDPPSSPTLVAAPPIEIEDEPSDVIVLEVKKPATHRIERVTQVGIGAVRAATRARVAGDAIPGEVEDEPTDVRPIVDYDPTRVDSIAAPPSDEYTSTSDEMLAAPPSPYGGDDTSPFAAPPAPSRATPPPSGAVAFDNVKRAPTRNDEDDDDLDDDTAVGTVKGKPTMVMSAVELDEMIPGRTSEINLSRRVPDDGDDDELDDGWGPPGSTIPPPLLGAIPGSVEPVSGIIPIPDMDSAPLMVAPPSPPERGARPHSASEAGIVRALEEATVRVLELIRTLDHTTNRDQVIAVMIAHLAESHQRAGFFVTRGGELSLFAITPRVPTMPVATLRLDRPSTLQDVVGTRLPYRGPMLDEASRVFIQAVLGACPPELLLVPIAVRERVVGVLFGDHRMRHTFDDQLALASRAAGMALERILKAKRG